MYSLKKITKYSITPWLYMSEIHITILKEATIVVLMVIKLRALVVDLITNQTSFLKVS